MSAPVPYFDLVRQMKNAFNYRLQLVSYARQHGIKKAARPVSTILGQIPPRPGVRADADRRHPVHTFLHHPLHLFVGEPVSVDVFASSARERKG